jgi:hypothetical protein
MNTIANGETSNIFTGNTNTLDALAEDIVEKICSSNRRTTTKKWKPTRIVKKYVWEAASKYINKMNDIPSWMPKYKLWKAGKIEHFEFERFSKV